MHKLPQNKRDHTLLNHGLRVIIDGCMWVCVNTSFVRVLCPCSWWLCYPNSSYKRGGWTGVSCVSCSISDSVVAPVVWEVLLMLLVQVHEHHSQPFLFWKKEIAPQTHSKKKFSCLFGNARMTCYALQNTKFNFKFSNESENTTFLGHTLFIPFTSYKNRANQTVI
jgi:hypothetical protein